MTRIHILAEGKYGGSLSCLVIGFEIKYPDYIVQFLFKGVQWTPLFQKMWFFSSSSCSDTTDLILFTWDSQSLGQW